MASKIINTLLFIDDRIADLNALVNHLPANTVWVALNQHSDAIDQMASTAEHYKNLESIHIISHGSVGSLTLGSITLNLQNLSLYGSQLKKIGSALSNSGDLLLYGCNVAQGDAGKAFIDSLAKVTGADVAASNDVTSSAQFGGNLVLEQSSGSVDAEVLSLQGLQPLALNTNSILYEGNGEQGACYTFDIVRSGNLNQSSTASWSVVGAGPAPATGSDFLNAVLPSGQITYSPGQSVVSVSFYLAGDSAVESDEQFSVILSNASAGTSITTASATGTILNDDALLTVSSLSSDRSSYWEGNTGVTPLTFTVTRSGYLNQATSVGWSVTGTGSNPANAADFAGGVLPSGTVSFAAGETSKTITVNVAGDTQVEALSETFSVRLSSPSAGATIATASSTTGVTGTILNDDGTPQLSISYPSSITEGSSGGLKQYGFSITRDINLSAASSLNWSVTGAGANPVDKADFKDGVLPSGSVYFGVNETVKWVYFDVIQDKLYEPDETFSVTLSGLQNAATSTPSFTGTITNDDTNWAIATTDVSKAEGNSGYTEYTYTVTRLGVPNGGTVDWSVAAESATASDFYGYNGKLPTGSLTFNGSQSSQSFTVRVAGDSLNESDETFSVNLSSANTNYPVYPTASSVRSTIVNDDASLGIISGTSSNDSLLGTAGNDSIYGYAGDDVLFGYDGDDYLNGGDGKDTFIGGVGNDTIELFEALSTMDSVVFSGGSGTTGSLSRVSTLGLDKILNINLGTNASTVDVLQFSQKDFGILSGTTPLFGNANLDGNCYIKLLGPDSTAVDLNGSTISNNAAFVFVGAPSGTDGVDVYFTTAEGSFNVNNSVQIAALIGINTSVLNSSDINFVD